MLLTTLILAHAPALAATDAQLYPSTVAPGAPATLTITTDTGATPTLGAIPGVHVTGTGRSTQVQIINGSVSQQTTFTYRLIPEAEGTYELGPYSVGPDKTPVLTLRADPSAARSAASPQPRRPAASSRSPQPAAAPDSERAFASLWLEDADPIVGQAVPLTVSAYLRQDVGGTLEAAPDLDAPDFIVEGLQEEPVRSETEVNGVPYTRFTWTASLTPVRAGDFAISAKIPATLQWMERSSAAPRRSLIEEMLANDPFFQGSGLSAFFQGFDSPAFSEPELRTARVDLSASRAISVGLPPADGRPADFSGAVGDFTLSLDSAPTEGTVGEPFELSWVLSGSGNFDAIDLPGVPDGDTWDSYPVERSFEPSVRSRTRGTLRLSQLIVPRSPGELSLPPLTFSWYNPSSGTYETSSLELPPVHVTGTASTAGSAAASGGAAASGSAASAPGSGDAAAAPQRDIRRPSLLPAAASSRVLWLVGALWGLLAAAWLLGGRLGAALTRLSGSALERGRAAVLRRRLRRAAERGDADAIIAAGRALIDAGAVDTSSEAARAFISELDRTLYGMLPPDIEVLSERARALLDGATAHPEKNKEAA